MSLEQIKEAIAIQMDMSCIEIWGEILDHTDPGHYGVEDIGCQISSSNIWVNVPELTFTFKDASLTFIARLGASRDGIDKHCEFNVSGNGSFEFLKDGKGGLRVTAFTINEQLDLFGREQRRR